MLVVYCMLLFLCLPSCTNEEDIIQNTTPADSLPSENTVEDTTADDKILNVEKIDPYIFSKCTPLDTIEKRITASDYSGAPTYDQVYTLSVYRSISDFTDIYSGKQFQKIIFDYENIGVVQVYKQYLCFHVVENSGENYVLRYNMDDGSQDIIFTYNGEYQIAIYTVNDDYIIWQEDENANWFKVSLNCYNIKTGHNEKFFTYSRDEKTGLMNHWNFDKIILSNAHVYFDNTENIIDNKPSINLYEYDIVNNTVKIIDEKRAASPFLYKGISWLSYDDNKNEYLIKNKNSEIPAISLGSDYAKIYASDNIVVGYKSSGKDGIMYYDGKDSIPIIESTGNIDEIYCTDSFITWDGWSNDSPKFYDINKQTIINVDCLEEGRRYAGYVDDDYLIFGAHDYIPDPLKGEETITTKSLIYYYIKTSDLN